LRLNQYLDTICYFALRSSIERYKEVLFSKEFPFVEEVPFVEDVAFVEEASGLPIVVSLDTSN
jgi:hypothetical protein